MIVGGEYAGQVNLSGRVYTAQDVVNLLAEHREMRERLAKIGTAFYDTQRLAEMLNAVRRALEAAAKGQHITYQIPVRPGTHCYTNCGRCLAEQLLVLLNG